MNMCPKYNVFIMNITLVSYGEGGGWNYPTRVFDSLKSPGRDRVKRLQLPYVLGYPWNIDLHWSIMMALCACVCRPFSPLSNW